MRRTPIVLVLLCIACGEPVEDPDGGDGGADAGMGDAEVARDGGRDASVTFDGGMIDGGMIDAGMIDGGMIDGGMIDAGMIDGGRETDAGRLADGGMDAGRDAGSMDGCTVPTTHATIAIALADVTCAVISVMPGTYDERVTIARSVEIRATAIGVILDGSAGGTVVTVEVGVTARLLGIVIQGGRVDRGVGGGIVNRGALTLEGVVVRNNTAASGAGIASFGALTLRATRVEDNTIDDTVTLSGGDGAGIFAMGGEVQLSIGSVVERNRIMGTRGDRGGGIAVDGTTLIVDASSVSDNEINVSNVGPFLAGGGISAVNGSTVTVQNGAVISGNDIATRSSDNSGQALGWGGGIYVLGSTLRVERSVISGNTIVGSGTLPPVLTGGAISADTSTVVVHDSTLAANSLTSGGGIGTSNGGGVFFTGMSTGPRLEIARSTLSGNTCVAGLMQGGGLAVDYRERNVDIVLDQNTFSGNSAAHGGGAFFYATGGNMAHVYLSSSTIKSNAGNTFIGLNGAGGIEASNNVFVHVRGSIVFGNTGTGADCYSRGGATIDSIGYNVYGDPADCTLSGTRIGDQTGVDPVLAALADNGGPTRTHLIGPGAAAHDMGNPAGCANALGPFTTDQRGLPRLVGRCDVGSVER
jgi:hypothetical protein